MLKDRVRTEAYRDALLENADSIKGKAVLDVGCGTGILSLFAMDAGARVVYAVDASKMADYTKRIVKANNADHVVKVIKGKIEDIELPEKVDVIVSEWMGYFLLYETMLDSVLIARDRWLKPGGKMFPTKAKLMLGAFTWPEYYRENLGYWTSVYGKDFTALLPLASRTHLERPVIDVITPQQEVTDCAVIRDIDLLTAQKHEFKSWSSGFI
uniref:type I protein arginine methyltransferase n=2 Tax=Lotharella globosa TaxID=91324 RepID=A0A7S3ZEE2_9EUKA